MFIANCKLLTRPILTFGEQQKAAVGMWTGNGEVLI